MEEPEKPDLSLQNERLRRLLAIARKVRDLSQRDVARRIGQPPSYIGKIENGMRGVSVVEMVQIAKAIGVDPRKIITKLLKGWPDAPPESQPPTEPPQNESA